MKYLLNINQEKLSYILDQNFRDPLLLKDLILNLNVGEDLRYKIFSIINEDNIVEILKSPAVIGDYLKDDSLKKSYFFYDNIIHVYTKNFGYEIETYKDEENIKSEVFNILRKIDDQGHLEKFLKDNGVYENIHNIFLSIDKKLPMVLSNEKNLRLFSMLANFTRNEIISSNFYNKYSLVSVSSNDILSLNSDVKLLLDNSYVIYTYTYDSLIEKRILKPKIGIVDVFPAKNLTKVLFNEKVYIWDGDNFVNTKISHTIPDNWDDISRIFKKFLKELSIGTINY